MLTGSAVVEEIITSEERFIVQCVAGIWRRPQQ